MDERLWWEDVQAGVRRTSEDYVVTREEIIAFASQWDPQPFHLSDEGAAGTLFGTLAASGWHTAAITMKLLVTSCLPLAEGSVGAGLELQWPTPTRPGDRLHIELEVESSRRSASKPDKGIVVLAYDTVNQDGQVRQRTRATALVSVKNP